MRNTILHSDNFPAKDFKMTKARAFGTIVMGQIPHNTENKGTLNLEPRSVMCPAPSSFIFVSCSNVFFSPIRF